MPVKQGTSGFVVRPFACGYQRQYAPISCENDKSDGMLVIDVEFIQPFPSASNWNETSFHVPTSGLGGAGSGVMSHPLK